MKNKIRALKWPARQGGSILVLLAIALPAVIGLAAYALNTAYLTYNQKRLQAIVNAAALSAAQDLWDSAWSVAQCRAYYYSAKYTAGSECPGSGAGGGGGVGNYNTLPSGITLNPPIITPLKLNNYNLSFQSSVSTYNAVRITQTASVPLLLVPRLGPATISATATAGAGNGGASPPINVMLVIDISGSMQGADLNAAKEGARALVSNLTMRANNTGLIVFPPVKTDAISYQKDCSANTTCKDFMNYWSGPQATAWADDNSYNTTSTIVPLTSAEDYAPNGTLNKDNDLIKAIGFTTPPSSSNSCGLESPGYCTYSTSASAMCSGYLLNSTCYVTQTSLAQAIYQAQDSLYKLSKGTNGNNQKNAIIVLSDGALNSNAVSQLTNSADEGETFATFKGNINDGTSSSSSGNILCVNSMIYGKLTIGSTVYSGTGTNRGTIQRFGSTIPVTKTACSANTAGTGYTGYYTLSTFANVSSDTLMTIKSNSTKYIPNQCQQAVKAANAAKNQGTTIYSIAYGTNTNKPSPTDPHSCMTETTIDKDFSATINQITPCRTMQWISGTAISLSPPNDDSVLPYFYKDKDATQTGCESSNSTGGLTKLFSDIYDTFGSRILPDDAS